MENIVNYKEGRVKISIKRNLKFCVILSILISVILSINQNCLANYSLFNSEQAVLAISSTKTQLTSKKGYFYILISGNGKTTTIIRS